jgi:uncharacterized RmlC-like cupin family protein
MEPFDRPPRVVAPIAVAGPAGVVHRNVGACSLLGGSVPSGPVTVQFGAGTGNTLLSVALSNLPTGTAYEPHRSLAETLIYGVGGSGRIRLSPGESSEVPVGWRAGDLVAVPASVPFVHEAAGPDGAEFLVFTTEPMWQRLFGDERVARGSFRFPERLPSDGSWDRRSTLEVGAVIANVVRDVANEPVAPAPQLGRSVGRSSTRLGGHRMLSMGILELGHRAHVRRHRHLVEEAAVVLSGKGRTILTRRDGSEDVFRWRAGDLFTVPLGVWHQQVSEAKSWDTTRLLFVRNRAIELAFGVPTDTLQSDIPSRFPTVLEPSGAAPGGPCGGSRPERSENTRNA